LKKAFLMCLTDVEDIGGMLGPLNRLMLYFFNKTTTQLLAITEMVDRDNRTQEHSAGGWSMREEG